jgi:hypothetical protein
MKNTDPRPPSGATAVALLACSSRDMAVLGMLLQRHLAGEFAIVAADRAQVAVIDGDSAGAAKALADWRSSQPEAPTLVLSLHPGADSARRVYVRKPIDVTALLGCLKKMRLALTASAAMPGQPTAPLAGAEVRSPPTAPMQPLRLTAAQFEPDSHGCCGVADDFPPRLLQTADRLSPDQAMQMYFDPDARLLGLLRMGARLARASNQAAGIRGLERPLVILPGKPMTVRSPLQDTMLRPLSASTLFSASVEIGPPPGIDDRDFVYDFDVLLWKVALWTARGRLPRGTDPNAPVRLQGLPDFSRLTVTPYAEAICQLWLKDGKRSPAATAAHLQIAQRYVFALYSAASMLELIGADHAR